MTTIKNNPYTTGRLMQIKKIETPRDKKTKIFTIYFKEELTGVFKNITEAKKKAKELYGDKLFTLYHLRDYDVLENNQEK